RIGARFMRAGSEPHYNFVLAPPSMTAAGLEWVGRGGDVLLRTLEAALVKAGGTLMRGMRVLQPLGNQACEGVRVEGPDGPVNVRASATIIADGGFAGARDILARHITPAPDKIFLRNAGTALGDGLRMAAEFGAATTQLDRFY